MNDDALLQKVELNDDEKHLPKHDNNDDSTIHANDAITKSYTPEEEKRLVRKLDMRIIPLFCAFYFVDFLDRSNIGNATIAGLQKDLQMTGPQLSTAISAFFITFILFQVPSNIVIKRLGARWWLSIIMLTWGLVTLSMALANNFASLLIARLLLGAAESGFAPGILYQMSRIYKPQELGFRVAIMLCMAAIAGIVSGPLAYASTSMEGVLGLHGWQYLFIFEGAPTVLLSLLAFYLIFDNVDDVNWLTAEQKAVQRARMLEVMEENSKDPITWKTIRIVLLDYKTWLFSAVFMLTSINLTSLNVFGPVLIDGFGFPVLQAQLLTTPPCVIAAVAVLLCGYVVDRLKNQRTLAVSSGSSIVAIGYLMLLLQQGRWFSYAGTFVIATGVGMEAPIGVSWSAINYHDLTVRAVGVAVVNMMGNLGSVGASFLYTIPGDPNHVFGNTFNLSCGVLCAIISAFTGILLRRKNKHREPQLRYFY
ncbi:hypothetical protein LRAMOSA00747 [Lichtheimia ramosa]|uniref:Major facilitator superfamily (MFS) profile domain-containing protein n=1 Tax=Lichtheimia ramosa TaxID=688394 RepID=A0A077W973_9FUNG|nr:hypothetical protein LRAMOSA00747 [Lichtheimia ramosa]